MTPELPRHALPLLVLLWGAACSDRTPAAELAVGGTSSEAGATEARAGANLGGAAESAGGAAGTSSAGEAGASQDCGPRWAPNAWASWRVPNPEAAGGDAGERYALTEDVTTDAVTGLDWQRHAAPELLDWQAASTYCACLSLGGHDDWTLPSRIELVSIVDYTRQNPALDEEAFPDTPSQWFWSASRTAESEERYWYVAFWDGNTHAASADQLYWTRCVRQSDGISPRYDLTQDDVVVDRSTQLTWQREASATRLAWEDAAKACALLTPPEAGWRLPDMKELQTLIDESRAAPAIDPAAFPATPAEGFWTATPLVGATDAAWFVSFDQGIAYNALRTHEYRYRCVR